MNIGRITEAHRTNFTVAFENKEYIATVRGVFHADGDFPKVGDYVNFEILDSEKAVIEEVHERASVIKRRAPETGEEQIIVTNVDLIFIVMGLDGDFNISRLERYLLLSKQSNIPAVVVLNKSDVVDDVFDYQSQVSDVVGETSVLTLSALLGEGLDELSSLITSGTTAVLLGSSGAGKSTITNWLLSEEKQAVKGIREDDSHGRHTTTSRQLFALPNGGYLIDTPGMRELGIFDSDKEAEEAVFERIESFAETCKFNNCDHDKSAGCAVQAAIEAGEITEREINNYHKLLREREWQDTKALDNSAHLAHEKDRRKQKMYSAAARKKAGR